MADRRVRTHEIVLGRIEDELTTGRLGLGQRLPGERGLAEQIGVSRASVREAIRVLEAMGVVRTSTGSGPDAGAVIVADPGAPLGAALRLHVATTHLLIDDIVATRVLLESWAVRAAADNEATLDFGETDRLLDAMDAADLSPAQFHRLDARFHVELTGLAGNAVVGAMMAALRESIEGYVLAAVPSLPDWPATTRKLRREHRRIAAAVRAGDADAAAALVARHITGFHRATGLGR